MGDLQIEKGFVIFMETIIIIEIFCLICWTNFTFSLASYKGVVFFIGINIISKGWLAIAKLKPLSLFISLLLMLKKAFYNVKIEKLKVKVV